MPNLDDPHQLRVATDDEILSEVEHSIRFHLYDRATALSAYVTARLAVMQDRHQQAVLAELADKAGGSTS